jgi:hypothetical protein
MGSTNSKVEYIMLPGQSGKTRKVEEMIRKYHGMSQVTTGSDENDINIIFCSNNRALVKQTEARMATNLFDESDSVVSSLDDDEEETSDAKIEGKVFSWFSGKNIKKITKERIILDIINDKIAMLICCANKIRMKYVFDVVKELNESRHFSRKIFIWLDEGDAYVKLWKDPKVDVTCFEKVAKVTPVSATFDSCIKQFDRIKIVKFEQTTNVETYHCFQDCRIVTDDSAGAAPDYFETIFEKHKDELCQPGVRLFIPGDNTTDTHDAIAESAVDKGMVVAIINGKRKALLFPDHRLPVSLMDQWDDNEPPEEIGIKIGKLYRDMNLSQFPFAITGHTCLSRGITFQNHLFMFDFGIIPNISNPATAYQTACRMNGNIRQLEGYKAPTVFMCSRMKDKVIQNEEIAKNMARICFEEDLADVGKEEFAKAAGGGGSVISNSDDNKKTVPIVIQSSAEEIETIHSSSPIIKQLLLLTKLKAFLITRNGVNDIAMADKLDEFAFKKAIMPIKEDSYKRNVLSLINGSINNRKQTVNFDKTENKTQNIWQAVLDNREHRIGYLIYLGVGL